MTTAVKIDTHAGWPVEVTRLEKGTGRPAGPTDILPAGATATVYLHAGLDLRLRELGRPPEPDPGADPRPVEGLPVAGYRPQSPAAVDKVNRMKRLEEQVLRELDALGFDDEIDKRWLAIGRTAIEQGFMATNRAVFRPGRVALED